MDCSAFLSLTLIVVEIYVPGEDPDVVGDFARNGARHRTRESGLTADNI